MGKAQNRIADADCSAQRCLNDAVCTDLLLGFTCGCPYNFTGPVCGQGRTSFMIITEGERNIYALAKLELNFMRHYDITHNTNY